jgi:hypothetical protein
VSARPNKPTETAALEPLGHLSPAEVHSARRDDDREAKRLAQSIDQAADVYYEATRYRQWFEKQLRERLAGLDFELVLSFCDWQARELYLRDKLERMRSGRN